MLSTKPVVIFVRPRAQGNVGALARVLSNFGLAKLRFVNAPAGTDAFTADAAPTDWAMACKGKSILENAEVYSSLSEALHDIQWALGTTARPREQNTGYTRPFAEFENFLQQKDFPDYRWALVIGTEDDGLTDREAAICSALTTIATDPTNPALNAAMAAGCLIYHWNLQRNLVSSRQTHSEKDAATVGDVAKLTQFIQTTLEDTEFFKYPDRANTEARIARLFSNERILDRGDILFAFEIFYQLKSKIRGTFADRNFLKLDPSSDLDGK